ncbi:NAD(P)-dependent dehydrogenase (short-subunit alcohol dehydrogenase family) [Streptomyces sp. V3I8]|uniref:SDR family NAD(P)-dependent oxidoreductase n=1 Tax=Streptomyces sp. V3I8 TaxID=3042279 RepID=UPI00278B607C|nr:SDR family NAD(P)-dependent oxidoreductase [Streptomyces sp. V3I8]MDQ1041662.1 NAD(P)-dependent dehydrogenase (short-subunit alcohol dehydrogenase family) [Streptomyces sp. V3I8]
MAEHRTALITGANRGLGRAVAAELADRGLRVLATARDGRAAVRTAEELGPRVSGHELDVSDPRSVRRAAGRLPAVDVLVCNAGVLLDGGRDVLTEPLELVRDTLEVNLLGGWRVVQAFVPGMVRRGWGRVVFVSSGTGSFRLGLWAGAPAYSLSKAAVNALTTMLADRTADTGVLVNAVNPGRVRTRMVPDAERTAQEAAVDIADAATLPDGGPTGAFLRDGEHLGW